VHFAATRKIPQPSPEPEATPEYYRNQPCLAWFKFRSITERPIDESAVVGHFSYASVSTLSETPRGEDARFANKVVASVREMKRQSRTLFFLKGTAPTHSRREIVVQPRLQVFLCHSSEDKERVRALYERLKADGISPWLDEENILPGQEWEFEILKAVKESDVVLVCLSASAVTKEGFVRREINFALNVAEEKPESTIFIIPARLEDCKVPPRLSRWQYVDLHREKGYGKLMSALSARAKRVASTESRERQ